MDHQQDAPQAAFDQTAQDVFPLLEVLASEAKQTGQDTLFAVAAQADDQVDRPGTKAITLTDLDLFGIEEEGEQIGVERASIAQLQFVDEVAGDGIEFLLGGGQSHFAQGALGRVHRPAGSQQIE